MRSSAGTGSSLDKARHQALQSRVIEPTRMDPAFTVVRRTATMLVPGTGSLQPQVVVVGEGPGDVEDRCGVPFVGPAGQLLDRYLALAGLDRQQIWITNVLKYRGCTPDGRDRRPTFYEEKAGRKYLAHELSILKPKLVILCGRVAYNAVCPGESIVKDRGTEFTLTTSPPGRWYFPVMHPAAVLRGPGEWDTLTRGDWKRVPSLL